MRTDYEEYGAVIELDGGDGELEWVDVKMSDETGLTHVAGAVFFDWIQVAECDRWRAGDKVVAVLYAVPFSRLFDLVAEETRLNGMSPMGRAGRVHEEAERDWETFSGKARRFCGEFEVREDDGVTYMVGGEIQEIKVTGGE